MKKIGFMLIAVMCIFASCGEKVKKYSLSGTLPAEFEGKKVYMIDSYRKKHNRTDSTTVTQGKFTFEGVASDTPVVRFIKLEDKSKPALFVIEKGNMTLSIDSVNNMPAVKGGKLNDAYYTYRDSLISLMDNFEDLNKKWDDIAQNEKLTPEKIAERKTEFDNYEDKIGDQVCGFIKSNINNGLGEYAFFTDTYFLKPEKLEELLPLGTQNFKDTENLAKVESRVKATLATSEGKPYTDIKGLDLKGKETSLSNYVGKGKVVMIDFWASWCGPCRRAMPEFRNLYEKYKGKGLEIVGVSLDDNKADWEKASKDEKITWPQFSNLKGWNEPAAKAYGVQSIPNTVIIDKDGKIAARNLHGGELNQKLDELLK